jgi:hypothetical protein
VAACLVNFKIISMLCAIGIHAGEQDFTRAKFHRLTEK